MQDPEPQPQWEEVLPMSGRGRNDLWGNDHVTVALAQIRTVLLAR
jgi:hypothetical protein